MRRAIVIFAWVLVAAGLGLAAGAALYALVLLLSAAGTGAFLILVAGLPAGLAILALLLGLAGRLPGTRRRP